MSVPAHVLYRPYFKVAWEWGLPPARNCMCLTMDMVADAGGDPCAGDEFLGLSERGATELALRRHGSLAMAYVDHLLDQGWREAAYPQQGKDFAIISGAVRLKGHEVYRTGRRRQIVAFVDDTCRFLYFGKRGLQPLLDTPEEYVLMRHPSNEIVTVGREL